MQQVANRANVAKSAAYYYFPSKEAIVQAYYEAVQAEQERLCADVFTRRKDVKARLSIAMHSKFDLAREDRRLLGVVFRYTGEPRAPTLVPRPRNCPNQTEGNGGLSSGNRDRASAE